MVLATRSERPVLTKLRAKKKARTMSQMTSLVKAWKAAWKGRMPEATVKVRQTSAQAPEGSGRSTRPATTETKKSAQAWEVTPAGWGHKNHSATAGATDAASGTSGAPPQGGAAGDPTDAAAAAAAGPRAEGKAARAPGARGAGAHGPWGACRHPQRPQGPLPAA